MGGFMDAVFSLWTLLGLVIYGVGWYVGGIAIGAYEIKAKAPKYAKIGCPYSGELDRYGEKQGVIDHTTCKLGHGAQHWRYTAEPVPEHIKRQLVGQSMKLALLWPLLAVGGALFGSGLLIWLFALKPIFLGAQRIGEGLVSGTVSMADHSMNVAVNTASRFSPLDPSIKALTAKVKEEPEVMETVEPEVKEGKVSYNRRRDLKDVTAQ